MKILILQGSPNTNGSKGILAHEFAAGAREAGHDVDVVDVASLDIAPCSPTSMTRRLKNRPRGRGRFRNR